MTLLAARESMERASYRYRGMLWDTITATGTAALASTAIAILLVIRSDPVSRAAGRFLKFVCELFV